MSAEPITAIIEALDDPVRFVRIGAIRATPWLAPQSAGAVLLPRYGALGDNPDVGEAATLALVLAGLGHDSLPLTARLLHDTRDNIEAALQGSPSDWLNYLAERTRTGGLRGPFAILMAFWACWWSARRRADTWQTEAPREKALQQCLAAKASYASGSLFCGEAMMARLEERFADVLSALDDVHPQTAIADLVEIALGANSEWARYIATRMLPVFGADASSRLLEVIANDRSAPSRQLFEIVARALGHDVRGAMRPDEVAAFFAGEALEMFDDASTGFAIANAALDWTGRPQARASRVAARMSMAAGLPPLIWMALNGEPETRRRTARELLRRIAVKDEPLGIRFHRIGVHEIQPGQIDWTLDLLDEKIAREWTSDVAVAIPVLEQAFLSMTDIAREVGYRYMDATDDMRASSYKRSIRALLTAKGRVFAKSRHPPKTEERHVDVEFPERCGMGREERLAICVVAEAGALTGRPFDLAFPRGEDAVDVSVLIQAPAFSMDRSFATLKVYRGRPSSPVIFTLVPREYGTQLIDIKIMCGTTVVGQSFVVTEVGDTAADGAAKTFPVDPLETELVQLRGSAHSVLQVRTLANGRLEWVLVQGELRGRSLGTSEARIEAAEAAEWVQKQSDFIREVMVSRLPKAELQTALPQLHATGYSLYKAVAPANLGSVLAQIPEGSVIVIDSDSEWIPWELLAADPTGPLWAERFVIVRAPVITKMDAGAAVQPSALDRALHEAVLVVGDDVPTRNLAWRTFGAMSDRVRCEFEPDFEALKGAVSAKDIVHFTCHGRKDPFNHLSLKSSVTGQFMAQQAHQIGLKWGSVVFANACNSNAPEAMLSNFQTFGRAFYLAGARPFIGTLAAVNTEDAISFAGIFYEKFAFAGLPAGQALRAARFEAARDLRTPVWLFYSLYGNPAISRRWSPG